MSTPSDMSQPPETNRYWRYYLGLFLFVLSLILPLLLDAAVAAATRIRGGQYKLDGIAGQPDAAILRSDKYILSGGFWIGAVPQQGVYLPIVQR